MINKDYRLCIIHMSSSTRFSQLQLANMTKYSNHSHSANVMTEKRTFS